MSAAEVSDPEFALNLLSSQLHKAIEDDTKKITLFLGAGCSLSSKSPGNTAITNTIDLIRDLIKEFSGEQLPKETDPVEIWEKFCVLWSPHRLGEQQKLAEVRKRLENLIPGEGYEYVKKLVQLGVVKSIITTNFDLIIDGLLADIPHEKVFAHKRIPHKEESADLKLLKVHGDIEHGGILFTPKDMNKLDKDLTTEINAVTGRTVVVIGYSGQDYGIMDSINRSCGYNAFWISPDYPNITQYKFSQIFSWMSARNSLANFIYGDEIGYFDTVVPRLYTAAKNSNTGFTGPEPRDLKGIIFEKIKVTPRVHQALHICFDCFDTIDASYSEDYQPPAFAADFREVHDILLNFIESEPFESHITKLLSNEVEALAFIIILNGFSRSANPRTYKTFILKVRELFEQKQRTYIPDENFWHFISEIMNFDSNDDSIQQIKIEINHSTGLALTSAVKSAKSYQAIISALNNILLFHPRTLETGVNTRADYLVSTEILSVSPRINTLDKKMMVTLSCSSDIATFIDDFSLHTEMMNTSDKKTAFIIHELVEIRCTIDETRNQKSLIHQDSYLELFSGLCSAVKQMYLSHKGFYDSNDHIPLKLDESLDRFIQSKFQATVIVGRSGCGKTDSIKHLLRNNPKDLPIICSAATSFYSFKEFLHGKIGNNSLPIETILSELNQLGEQNNKRILLIAEGVNEFASFNNAIMSEIAELIGICIENGYRQIKFIITTRPSFFSKNIDIFEEIAEHAFYDESLPGEQKPFRSIKVNPLSHSERESLIDYYFDGELKSTINKLATELPKVNELLSSPFLISLASKTINTTNDIHQFSSANSISRSYCEQILQNVPDGASSEELLTFINALLELMIDKSDGSLKTTEYQLRAKFPQNFGRLFMHFSDANILQRDTLGFIRFTHDKMFEYFLGKYLYVNIQDVHSATFRAAKAFRTNPAFDSALLVLSNLFFEGFDQNIEDVRKLQTFIFSYILPGNRRFLSILIENATTLGNYSDVMQRLLALGNKAENMEVLLDALWISAEHVSLKVIAPTVELFDDSCPSKLFIGSRISEVTAAINDHTLDNRLEVVGDRIQHLADNPDVKMYSNFADRVLYINAKILQETGDITAAIEKFNRLMRSQMIVKNIQGAVKSGLEIGRALRDNTKFEQAVSLYSTLETLSPISSNQIAQINLQKATVLKNIIQNESYDKQRTPEIYEQAMKCLDKCTEISGENGLTSPLIESGVEYIELNLATYYKVKDEKFISNAVHWVTHVQEFFNKYPTHKQYIAFLRQKAKIAEINGNFKEATDTLIFAREIAVKLNYGFYVTDCNYQLGHFILDNNLHHHSSDTFLLAKNCFEDAIAYYEDFCAADNIYLNKCRASLSRLMNVNS